LVFARHGYDQTQVRHDEALPSGLGLTHGLASFHDAGLGAQATRSQAFLSLLAVLDEDRELDLLFLREEWLARRRLQVQPEIVGVIGAQRTCRFWHPSFLSPRSLLPVGARTAPLEVFGTSGRPPEQTKKPASASRRWLILASGALLCKGPRM
jgi:hypothetical protein